MRSGVLQTARKNRENRSRRDYGTARPTSDNEWVCGALDIGVRIVSYNILDGGGGREEALGAVIEAQRPDVVALVESDHVDVVERLARRLKMDFVHAPGNTHASAVLSRWPVRESINHALLHFDRLEKSFLEATVAEPGGGKEWTLGVVHLHAHATEKAEHRREQEIQVVLEAFSVHRSNGRPHLICGDFNANAPYQRIDPQRCKPRTRKEWDENGGGLPGRVVQRMLDSGYRDSLREVDPVGAEVKGSFNTEYPGQRVDYVFTHGFEPGRLTRAWVVYTPPAKEARDHFPGGVEVE
jgi:endonuclease/exonuclease/phosphatase family metal-dependent hydrolase